MKSHGLLASLGLVFLLGTSCAKTQISSPIRLPEPRLPQCLSEATPKAGEAVGKIEYNAEWLRGVNKNRDTQPKLALDQAFQCLSDTAKAAAQGIGAIRLNNR